MQPVDLVIFGASGDLSARKLFPALFQLLKAGLLPEDLRIAAIARDEVSKEAFLEVLRERFTSRMGEYAPDDDEWQRYSEHFAYIAADFSVIDQYSALKDWLDDARISLFYLATPPSLFAPICSNLDEANCLTGDCRIVLEKPIGESLETSRHVNNTLAKHFDESSIYRIDHYLGKETVQNLLVLRFANRFINSQWDHSCIDHVQITVAETVGIEGRWSYYDNVGQMRDMVQNHLMQLLCLVAMEPPNSLDAESIRDEKVKIVKALRTIDASTVDEHLVRGQYSRGWSVGNAVPGYLEEPGCKASTSNTETFVAIKAHIDNWRWAGVPFYLRTGKRMAEKVTEIIIHYKELPHNIFGRGRNFPNALIIRLQPDEGIEMAMVSKRQSLKDKLALQTHTLNFDFRDGDESERIPDAYERLFLDAINGDQSLFVGREEIEESWRWVDGLIKASEAQSVDAKSYHAGSWGPAKAEILIEKDGRSWHV
ncbi:glucose-6-phosphate dehydrogenase [Luminiphilus syltensis NOR5-1B]|uniref:Glucose-6-phosphate 1-dehydrogenase n=2 Tax=Luminiphilus TaxID=1341118 RepID=B8KWX6_9GAMM|nr:glucose-6-phosphate dehydrogenase [Luminiphilus syltensis]EED34368.1 glucose-6-phosphate dehydrogenase [Luminiphilus syltensis NOR5-1B]